MRLPVARDPRTERWRSGQWFLRGERCYLVPGDSAMGYRLPLDSLPWTSANDYPYIFPPDPTQPLPPLATHGQIRFLVDPGKPAASTASRLDSGGGQRIDSERAPGKHESAAWISRTAICAEARNGVLYIFMPPTAALEDYLELVAAVEATAEALKSADHVRRLRAAARSAPAALSHHSGPGRDRGQYSSVVELGRVERTDGVSLRNGAPVASIDGKIHDRRPPHRHRRRQSFRPRRRHAGGFAVAQAAGSVAQFFKLLA